MRVTSGTVSVAIGGSVVTGVGTDWLSAGIIPGLSVFTVDGLIGHQAVISRVASDTTLHLAQPWTGPTQSSAAYLVTVDFTPSVGLPLVDETDIEIPAVWNTAFQRIADRLTLIGAPPLITLPTIDETTQNVPELWNTAMNEVTARLADLGISV